MIDDRALIVVTLEIVGAFVLWFADYGLFAIWMMLLAHMGVKEIRNV